MPDVAQSQLTPVPGQYADDAVTHFSLARLPAMPWKNGGGTTREIACWPPGSDMETFDWRISVARIDRDGAFSAFAGIDRVITLLDGAGVLLRGVDHALTRPLAPYAFQGEASVFGELIDGPCEDLNVMSRRANIDADVRALHTSAEVHETCAGMLLAVHASWQVHGPDGARLVLAPGEGIWWHARIGAWTVAPETAQPQVRTPQASLIAVAMRSTPTSRFSGGAA